MLFKRFALNEIDCYSYVAAAFYRYGNIKKVNICWKNFTFHLYFESVMHSPSYYILYHRFLFRHPPSSFSRHSKPAKGKKRRKNPERYWKETRETERDPFKANMSRCCQWKLSGGEGGGEAPLPAAAAAAFFGSDSLGGTAAASSSRRFQSPFPLFH